ncbi:hypothetical protein [Streptomyces kronopolitis]
MRQAEFDRRLTVDDDHFGPVTLSLPGVGGNEVHVGAAALPSAILRRTGVERDHRQAPIGTRDPARLAMYLEGRAVSLTSGRGRVRKASFRVGVHAGGRRYAFMPTSKAVSTLHRDGKMVARFVWTADRKSAAIWSPDPSYVPQAEDAAVGYLLAASFGTGAAGAFSLLLDAVSEIIDMK